MQRLRWIAICIAILGLSACQMPSMPAEQNPQALAMPAVSPLEFGEPQELLLPPETEAVGDAPSEDAPQLFEPIVIGIREAAMRALQQNPAFQVERLTPAIRQTYEQQERAVFDPTITGEVSVARDTTEKDSETGGSDSDERTRKLARTGEIGVQKAFPMGTIVAVTARRERSDTFYDRNRDDDARSASLDVTVTQSLLQGRGPAVNLARLRQTELDTRISRHILESAAETLVYQAETTGWDYILARRQIDIYEESLKLAENQLAEVRERIRVGALADIELAAFEAEVAQRKEDMINARSGLSKTRLELFRLLGVPSTGEWNRELTLTDMPEPPNDPLAPVEQHIALARSYRADLKEARLQIERGELDLVRTRNGLLPRLDFFVTLGGSRYADSFGATGKDDRGYIRDVSAGLQLDYTLGRRREKAEYDRSVYSLHQVREALRNQEDLAQVDVRTAYLEVKRTAEQIEATKATRKYREAALHAEHEKFRVGKSTSLNVAQAQRDLVVSRIAEIEAVIDHLKSRLSLYYQEGSLLERRGIEMR